MIEEVETAADRLRIGIASIPGWDSAFHEAHYGGTYAVKLGRLISAMLLAADEEREPNAVAGALDNGGDGYIAVAYDHFLVIADVRELSERTGDTKVEVHGFDDVESIEVATGHNHLGQQGMQQPRDTIELRLVVSGRSIEFKTSRWAESPLVKGEAILTAFKAIRDHVSAARLYDR